MAESKLLVGRISRLETAFVQITELLVDHNERFDRVDRRLESMDQRLERVDQRLERMDQRLESMDQRLAGVTDRLDRLIAVTIQERTAHYERLDDIERRLTRLEDRIGV